MSKSNIPAKPAPLVEDLDYYIENGYWVFTEFYHRKRGFCCGSGCRHCPYPLRPSQKDDETPAKP